MRLAIVTAAFAMTAFCGSAAIAQSAADTGPKIDGPAETPPPDYDGQTFVDSRGCVFARAGVNGVVNWVPRLGGDRKPMCGYPPTVIVQPKSEVAPAVPAVTAVAGAGDPPAGALPDVAAAASAIPATPDAALLKQTASNAAKPASVAKPGDAKASKARATPKRAVRAAKTAVIRLPTAIVKRDGLWRQIELPQPATQGKVAAAGQYIQVGAFGRPENAQGAKARLRATGLPVGTAEVRKGNTRLHLVLTGPFQDATAMQDALKRLHAAGFADAFIL